MNSTSDSNSYVATFLIMKNGLEVMSQTTQMKEFLCIAGSLNFYQLKKTWKLKKCFLLIDHYKKTQFTQQKNWKI